MVRVRCRGHQELRKIVVVGNGDVSGNHADYVDSSDFVIRFNCPNLHQGKSGERTDMLFLANAASCLNQFVISGALERSEAFRAAQFVVLPKHPVVMASRTHVKSATPFRIFGRPSPNRFDGDVYASSAVDYFGQLGKTVMFLPVEFFNQCCAEICLPRKGALKQYPSTGMMGVYYALTALSNADDIISILGFTWEGKDLHPWASERLWMQSQDGLRFIEPLPPHHSSLAAEIVTR